MESCFGDGLPLAGENHLLELVASGHPLMAILQALCRFAEHAVEQGCQCAVLLIDNSGLHLHAAAAPSLPPSFIAAIAKLPVSEHAGPCARAACLKTQVIVADFESEPCGHSPDFRPLSHGQRSCWSTPIYSQAGNVLGIFSVWRALPGVPSEGQKEVISKITHIASIAIERAQADAALKRSETFLAEAQRLSGTGSFSWKLSGDEIAWSEELYRIFGFEPGTPVSMPRILTRIHPEDMAAMRSALENAYRGGEDIGFEHRLLMPDGSVKYLHMVARRKQHPDGTLEYLGAVQDVTQRRLSEEALGNARSELAHAARVMSLGALTASIAHEVNQPLSGIITNSGTCLRMLNSDPPDIEGARETVRRTLRDGNRASEVIRRLRTLFGKSGSRSESVDLNEATREIIALTRSELQRNRVIVRTELAEDLPPVCGDRVQLQQVILNLLLNACDAMAGVEDRARQLSIRTECEAGNLVRWHVKDSGVGLATQEMARLFEPFYTTKFDGMGIGLFVSKSIIESHQGRLQVEVNDGPGVTFSFSVPSRRARPFGFLGHAVAAQIQRHAM